MPSDYGFRLSTYLSLGLACLCLGYAEWDLVPETVAFTIIVVISLIVSFRLEGRYTMSIPEANRIGAVIAVLVAGWLGYRYFHPPAGLKDLHWPTGLLPYLGPLLMVLIPAKLFRSKHIGDWWAIHAIGAAAVGLACAVAEDGFFGALLLTYFVVALWSIAHFVRLRWVGMLPPVPGYPARSVPIVLSAGGNHPAAAFGWLALSAVVALPLFFLTPRSPVSRWQVRAAAETGYTGEKTVDLTTTGPIQVSRSIAYTVEAINADGSPKTDLNANTRWRGERLATYEKGKWTDPTHNLDLFRLEFNPRLGQQLDEPLPDGCTLTFYPDAEQLSPVLASPVFWESGRATPVATILEDGRLRLWDQDTDGSFVLPLDCSPDPRVAGRRKLDPYRQVTRQNKVILDVGPGFELSADGSNPNDALNALRQLPTEGSRSIRAWADDFLARLLRDGKLPAEAVGPSPPPRTGMWVRPQYYEAVAKHFAEHFAKSDEFKYGLDLKRSDDSLDPVEDFLLHEKSGHCQRFASATALTLRAVGVPCALVIGFKGCVAEGNGKYTIRQEHAHAWVNVLVPRPDRLWHFLVVDPTPEEPIAIVAGGETWFGAAREVGRSVYTDYIVGYDPDRRKEVFEVGYQHASENGWYYLWGLVAVAGVLGVIELIRGSLRRPSRSRVAMGNGIDWYEAMMTTLAAAGYPVRPGQTPGEHAAKASAALRADSRTASVADIPIDAAAALYELRYAGRPLTPERQSALIAAGSRLAHVLQHEGVS